MSVSPSHRKHYGAKALHPDDAAGNHGPIRGRCLGERKSMMTLRLRRLLSPALVAGVAFTFAMAQPRTASACAQAQCAYVKMLLHRNALAIRHQMRYIAAQDSLVAKQQQLASVVPTTPQIQKQIQHLGVAIQKFNMLLQPAKLKLINFMTQTYYALQKLEKLAPPGSAYYQCYEDSLNTFKKQIEQAQDIINRPPVTPFVPSSTASGSATAPSFGGGAHGGGFTRTIDVHPRHPIQVHRTHPVNPRPTRVTHPRHVGDRDDD